MSLHHFFGAEPRIVLAPMEGVVDAVLREMICEIGGVDLCLTEFIRVTDRLLPAKEYFKYAPELAHGCKTARGVPVLLQLLGGQAQPLAENAALACELGAAGIDLNFGCPAKTVNRHDGGATLLKDPQRVFDITSAVRRAVPEHLTVSVKVRLGFSDKSKHIEIARAAESGGASWLTVHARTRDEGYRPPAHWEYIAFMRESVHIPVIANGEIWSVADAVKAREISGCRHLMLGRGLVARPTLAREIRSDEPSIHLASLVEIFAEKSRQFRSEHYAVCRTKQWLRSLSRHSQWAEEAFADIKLYDDYAPVLARLRSEIRQRAPLYTSDASPTGAWTSTKSIGPGAESSRGYLRVSSPPLGE